MVVALRQQQYNVGRSPPLYCTFTLIAMQGSQKNSLKKQKTPSHMVVIIYCYIGCENEVTTLKRRCTQGAYYEHCRYACQAARENAPVARILSHHSHRCNVPHSIRENTPCHHVMLATCVHGVPKECLRTLGVSRHQSTAQRSLGRGHYAGTFNMPTSYQ